MKVVAGKVTPATGYHQWFPKQEPQESLVYPWLPEGLDPGRIEPPGFRGVAGGGIGMGQEAAGQMGTSVCLQQPGPGKDIPNQTPDQTD